MARWIWLAAAWLLGAAAAASYGEEADAGRLSKSPGACQSFDAMRERTADLFRRPLTKEEYYKRNFMWLRCRMMKTKSFDMGGSWFGQGGKAIKDAVGVGNFDFKYIQGDWGDASIAFDTILPLTLRRAVEMLQRVAKPAMDRYKRTLYIVDCPHFEIETFYVTERAQTDWPRIKKKPPLSHTIARYNSRDLPPRNHTG